MEEEQIKNKMLKLAGLINYEPNNLSFLEKAMHCQIIHSEFDGKNRKNYTNDSLATLGDSILKFVLTEFLFDKGYDKSQITKKKEKLEKNDFLYNLCNSTGIIKYAFNDNYFYEEAPKECQVYHAKHDVYIEAIIAAIYKDRGLEYCKQWIISFIEQLI